MAIKKYLVKNKKKNICIFLAMILFVATIFGVNYVNNTKAGVFVKDENGNTIQIDDVSILEIVAQEGQQVLGYTVEGQEPISIDQINNYVGTMDMDVEDFRDATGYVVKKEKRSDGTFKYTVQASQLNKSFNDNVLGSSMAPGHIHVNVKQASDVTKSDINNANLVFINTNDYNDNLLYYYDQFVYGGELGVLPGDKGATYNDKYDTIAEKYVVVLSKIMAAAGDADKVEEISADDIEYLSIIEKAKGNIIDFKACNIEKYRQTIAELEENYFDGKDMIGEIINIVSDSNVKAANEAIETIKNASAQPDIVNEQERMAIVFESAELDDYIPENIEEYCQYLASMTVKISTSVARNIPKNVNGNVLVATLPLIRESVATYKDAKAKIIIPEEGTVLTEEQIEANIQLEEIMNTEAEKLQGYLKKLNLGVVNDLFAAEYLEMLTSDETVFTDDAHDSEMIRNIIQTSNNTGEARIKQLMVDMVGKDDKVLLSLFEENAGAIFEYLDFENYNRFYLNIYLDKMYELGEGAFSNEEGTFSKEKVDEFLLTNNSNTNLTESVVVSGDISWKVAKYLYESVMQEKVALMYNTEILTSKTIGDYEDADIVENTESEQGYDNTNNLYKILLLIRQIRYEYYTTDIADKIDSKGAYYANGINEGETGVLSWSKYTFGDDLANYEKYREPDVVGKTYGADGTEGNDTNYVNKKIYSFTGREFFGGKAFNELAETQETVTGVITTGLGYAEGSDPSAVFGVLNDESALDYVEGSDIIFLDTTKYSTSFDSYAIFYDSNYKDIGTAKMKVLYKSQGGKFYVSVPKTAKYVIFSPSSNSGDTNATARITLPDNRDGLQYYVQGKHQGKLYCVNLETELKYFDNDNKIYLDATVLGWKNAYIHIWGDNGTIGDDLIKMDKDKNNGLYYYDLSNLSTSDRKNVKKVLFRDSNKWDNGNNSLNIPVSDFIVGTRSYVVKLTGECYGNTNDFYTRYMYAIGADNDKIMSTVFLTNSICYSDDVNTTSPGMDDYSSRVIYNGSISLKARVYNATDVQFKNASTGVTENTTFTDLADGSEFTLGAPSQLDEMKRTRLEIKFTPYNNNGGASINKVCFFRQKSPVGYITIDNFIKDGTIEYIDKMDMTIGYGSISNVTYTIDDGNVNDVISGNKIEIGESFEVGSSHKITVNYVMKNEPRTVTTTVVKKDPATLYESINYLSKNTATNGSGLLYDNTLTAGDNSAIVGADKGGIIRYILGVSITEINFPVRVLEIEPGASVTVLDSYAGAQRLASYFNVNIEGMNQSNYKEYFDVTYMSVKEFNTRNDDLTATYDLIYFGTDTGYQVLNNYNVNGKTVSRTKYRDTSMNGLVYTGIGDLYDVKPFFRGTSAKDYKTEQFTGTMNNTHISDYRIWANYFFDGFTGNSIPDWNLALPNTLATTDSYGRIKNAGDGNNYYVVKATNTTTRLGGNDITVMKMDELLEYLKAGYPILMEDELLNCVDVNGNAGNYIDCDNNVANAAKWKYVADNSKMYNFILRAKRLGYDEATRTYSRSEDFYDGRTYAGLVGVSTAKSGGNPEYLAVENKFKGGLGFAYKRSYRLEFEFVSGPQDYRKKADGTDIAPGNTGTVITKTHKDYKSYEIVIGINSAYGVSESQLDNYGYSMYVDKSGVGKFEENETIELEVTPEFIKNEAGKVTGIKLTGNWPGALEGFVPWKVDVYNINNKLNKYEYIGYSAFENVSSELKDIYVLWIKPTGGSSGNRCTLDFSSQIENNKTQLENAGYSLHVVAMQYSEFDALHPNNDSTDEIVVNPDKTYTKETTELKVKNVYEATRDQGNSKNYDKNMSEYIDDLDDDKEFDMIVIGFADSHSDMDLKRIASLKDIEYFVSAGHSLLFTHDNSSMYTTMNYYTGTTSIANQDGNNVTRANPFSRYMTSFLRNMLGMDQYGISVGNDGLLTNLPDDNTQKYMYTNARKYIDSTNEDDYRGYSELTTFHYTSGGVGNELYSSSLHGTSKQDITDWCHTIKIMRTNEGQITDYPYIMDEKMTVTLTHSQYITLNVENPNLTIWYTLDNDGSLTSVSEGSNPEFYKWTKGDGTNNFYIYSNGNITYTGAGHRPISEDKEIKLFINTVIAAIKAGNYEPEVKLYNARKGTLDGEEVNFVDYYTGSSGIHVSFAGIDYDLKAETNAFTDCKIFVDINNDGKYNGNDILLNDPDKCMLTNSIGTELMKFIGTEILNRHVYSFMIPNDSISKINDEISEIESGKELKDYSICIGIWDRGYLKTVNPIPAYASASFRINETEPSNIFDLK